jgi:hypothetical protein
MSPESSDTPRQNLSRHAAAAIDFAALDEATHVDLAGRNLAGLTVGGRPWDADQLAAAAKSLAQRGRQVIIVTGFCRLSAAGMTAETDGPPGALFLARALASVGVDPVLVTDRYAIPLLEAGCEHFGLSRAIVHEMPIENHSFGDALPASDQWCERFFAGPGRNATHLVAIERPGPSHTLQSLAAQQRADSAPIDRFEREVPPADQNRHHNMRGEPIDRFVAKTDRLWAWIERTGAAITTIGIGDGGNELGMGAIPWETLTDALGGPVAGRIVCRVSADHLLLAGVSDWGAYALALATTVLREARDTAKAWNAEGQADLVRLLVSQAGAVDGKTGQPTATVDGLELDVYLSPLVKLRASLGLET